MSTGITNHLKGNKKDNKSCNCVYKPLSKKYIIM